MSHQEKVPAGVTGPRLDRRQLLRMFGAVAAVGATGAAASCSADIATSQPEQPSGRTISIGLISPALGAYAKIGDDIQKGFKLYLDDNDHLLGLHRVDLKTAEEGPTPESASAALKGLLNQGVLAIAGVASPAALAVLAPAMATAQIPLVSSSVSPTALASATHLWRASSVEGEAGQALAPYARAQGANAYVLAEDTATGREEAAAFRKTLSDLGGRIVGQTIGKTSFGSRLQDAKAANASVIFGAHTGADALALLDAYRVSGLTIKLIGPGSLTETADIAKLPSLPANVYTAMYYAADLDNDANRRFVSSYFKAYEAQPSGYAMAAYDSALVLNKALRQIEGGGQPTSPELNKALGLLGQIESPRGTWAFNEKRSPQQRWYLRHLRLDGMVPANLLDTNLQVLS